MTQDETRKAFEAEADKLVHLLGERFGVNGKGLKRLIMEGWNKGFVAGEQRGREVEREEQRQAKLKACRHLNTHHEGSLGEFCDNCGSPV